MIDKKVISVIGSGGKTSFILDFAKKIKENGEKVAISTTTKLAKMNYDVDFVCTDINEENSRKLFLENDSIIFAKDIGEKLSSPNDDFFEYITKYCDYLLIEADGSNRKPLKITNKTEPVITKNNEFIVAVFGLSAISKNAKEVCHRFDEDLVVDIDFFCDKILLNIEKHKDKPMKIILNQADTKKDIENAEKIKKKLQFLGMEIETRCFKWEF